MPLDDGAELAKLMRRFFPLFFEQAWSTAATAVGVEIAFDLANDAVQEILEEMTLAHVKSIIGTTDDEVRRLTGQAAAEGWSPSELAAAIRERGITAVKTRSELIAITASAEAQSRGSLLYYERSGVVKGTEWLIADTPCPEICEPIAGTIAALGEEFAPGIKHPPAHVRCRCSLAPVLE